MVRRCGSDFDCCARQVERDRVLLAHHAPPEPDRGFDHIQLGIEVDLVELVDEDDGAVAVGLPIAGRDLDLEPIARAIAAALHRGVILGLGPLQFACADVPLTEARSQIARNDARLEPYVQRLKAALRARSFVSSTYGAQPTDWSP